MTGPAQRDAPSLDTTGAVVAGLFIRRVLFVQAFVGVIAFFIVNLLAPWSLMLESQRLSQLWLTGLEVGVLAVAGTAVLSLPRLRASRAVFRRLAFEPEQVTPENIGTLVKLPIALTWRFVIVGMLAAMLMLVPDVRPRDLGESRAISLALLTGTIVVASAVVQYVAIRNATLRVIELSPIAPFTTWLEQESLRLAPQRLMTRRILLAVVAPVALVGVGTVLVSHAHLRAFVERSRTTTAVQLAQTALDPVAGAVSEEGRDDAMAAAAAHGFFVQYHRGTKLSKDHQALVERTASGQLLTQTAIEDGRAAVRYTAMLSPAVVTTSVWLTLLAVLLAAALALAFGRALTRDLVLATGQVSSLGTERVLRGDARVAGRARFSLVAQVGRSVEALSERFRVFAAAQERALVAKVAAQRIKQLLFASVSHDLKSPLNAVLGFADLVREEPLTQAQTESLDMVSGRGRELLVLIETILDAARVEAGQLRLAPQALAPDTLIRDALAKARDLSGNQNADIVVELAPGMPPLLVDPAHAPRALAVLITHALQTATESSPRAVRLRGTLPAVGRDQQPAPAMARFHIGFVASANRPSLLEAQLEGKLPSSTDRGMVLRLSLARAIIELHGGRIEVGRGPHGAAVVTCWLPVITTNPLPA